MLDIFQFTISGLHIKHLVIHRTSFPSSSLSMMRVSPRPNHIHLYSEQRLTNKLQHGTRFHSLLHHYVLTHSIASLCVFWFFTYCNAHTTKIRSKQNIIKKITTKKSFICVHSPYTDINRILEILCSPTICYKKFLNKSYFVSEMMVNFCVFKVNPY